MQVAKLSGQKSLSSANLAQDQVLDILQTVISYYIAQHLERILEASFFEPDKGIVSNMTEEAIGLCPTNYCRKRSSAEQVQ
uniref:Uncharacterized protein n=1 Tax=Romanomermis culicivorax TaxID=13658 RepID=A0A915L1W4_ROMCU